MHTLGHLDVIQKVADAAISFLVVLVVVQVHLLFFQGADEPFGIDIFHRVPYSGHADLRAVDLLVAAAYVDIPLLAWRNLKQRKQRELALERPSGERAMRRWERLYYCARDDGAFVPGETSLMPIHQIQSYLYAD